MARKDFGYLPRGNPCAQCGQPIAAPDWTEYGPRRISYLWHCEACDYKFEAVDEAAELAGFFFGEEMAEQIRKKGSVVLPECTGVWWRKV